MDVLSELKKIINSGEHYLKVLNDINNFLFNGGYVKYSAFYFYRGEKEYLVAYVGEEDKDKSVLIEITKRDSRKLGYWEFISSLDDEVFIEASKLMSKNIFFAEWEYSFSFTQNRGCEYFPCHNVSEENEFSCLFCYCPLYLMPDCGGKFSLLPNGVKDCSNCLLPHKEENYKYIVKKLATYNVKGDSYE